MLGEELGVGGGDTMDVRITLFASFFLYIFFPFFSPFFFRKKKRFLFPPEIVKGKGEYMYEYIERNVLLSSRGLYTNDGCVCFVKSNGYLMVGKEKRSSG